MRRVLALLIVLVCAACQTEAPPAATAFPGMSVGPEGFQLPGMSVGPGGIQLPGMSVGPGGVQMPGMSVGPGGVQMPGMSVGPGGVVVTPGTGAPGTAAAAAGAPASFGVPECDEYARVACSCTTEMLRAQMCQTAATSFQAWSAAIQMAPSARDGIVQGCVAARAGIAATCGN